MEMAKHDNKHAAHLINVKKSLDSNGKVSRFCALPLGVSYHVLPSRYIKMISSA
jgi:hypothetical protein